MWEVKWSNILAINYINDLFHTDITLQSLYCIKCPLSKTAGMLYPFGRRGHSSLHMIFHRLAYLLELLTLFPVILHLIFSCNQYFILWLSGNNKFNQLKGLYSLLFCYLSVVCLKKITPSWGPFNCPEMNQSITL